MTSHLLRRHLIAIATIALLSGLIWFLIMAPDLEYWPRAVIASTLAGSMVWFCGWAKLS